VSDWLDGEGIPFFRLDGNTPQDQRQKDIDAFNAPGATTNLFILSTRGA
jgi:chromodomain-helicase-DNA-binding protein 4